MLPEKEATGKAKETAIMLEAERPASPKKPETRSSTPAFQRGNLFP
jgi:hypothetical protein